MSGSLHFFLYYWKINTVLIRDLYPVSLTDEFNDSLGGAAVFFILDVNDNYFQVELDETDREKTVFTSHHGLY